MTSPSVLAALAAAFVPARAAALSRAPDPAVAAEVLRLAQLPREARLEALASALCAARAPSRRAREDSAAAERPRLAAMVRGAVAAGKPGGLLARLIVERLGGS